MSNQVIKLFSEQMAETTSQRDEAVARLAAAQQLIANKDAQLAEKDNVIAAKDKEIAELKAQGNRQHTKN